MSTPSATTTFPNFEAQLEAFEVARGLKRGGGWEFVSAWYLRTHGYTDVHRPAFTDLGVDLVAIDERGESTAIQCKHYKGWLTMDGISHFVAASPTYRSRILMATTDQIGRNALAVANDNNVRLLLRSDFERESWPESPDHLVVEKPRALKAPRPDQQAAIDAIISEVATGKSRVHICEPPGWGKTLMAFHYVLQTDARRVLFLVPKLSLADQAWCEFHEQYVLGHNARTFQYSVVCSDNDTRADEPDAMSFERANMHMRATTNVVDLATEMRTAATDRPYYIFATYQSIDVVIEAVKQVGFAFDVVIEDEVHHLTGSNVLFPKVLDDSLLPAAVRVGMTATPKYVRIPALQQAQVAGVADRVFSMDQPELFGRMVHRTTIKEAQDHEPPLLAKFQVVIVEVTDEVLREWLHDRENVKIAGFTRDIEVSFAATSFAIELIHKEFGARHIVNFVNTCDEAARSAALHRHLSPESFADFVTGEQPMSARNLKLSRWLDSPAPYGVLSNVRILNEGTNIPAIDAVVLSPTKSSEGDIIQSMGRALRLNENLNKVATILVPVPVGPEDDADAAFDAAAPRISFVVRALNEGKLPASAVDVLTFGRGPIRGSDPRKVFKVLTPRSLDVAGARRKIQLRVVNASREVDWEERARLVLAHLKKKTTSRGLDHLAGTTHLIDKIAPEANEVDENGNPVGRWFEFLRRREFAAR